MQQLMVGVYLAEFCLLGLFAINIGNSAVAVGPLVLQIILVVVTVIFHLAMRKKLNPLVGTLPLNLLEELDAHRSKQVHRQGHAHGFGDYEGYTDTVDQTVSNEGTARNDSNDMHPGYTGANQDPRNQDTEVEKLHKRRLSTTPSAHTLGLVSGATANFGTDYRTKAEGQDIANSLPSNSTSNGTSTQPQKRSLFQRLFKPHSQSAASLSKTLNPRFRDPVQPYDVQEARKAYLHPAIVAEPPVIWLAKDALGVSAKEVGDLREKLGEHGVEVTDGGGAVVNAKGKVEWVGDQRSVRDAPLWEERVFY